MKVGRIEVWIKQPEDMGSMMWHLGYVRLGFGYVTIVHVIENCNILSIQTPFLLLVPFTFSVTYSSFIYIWTQIHFFSFRFKFVIILNCLPCIVV
jgi:hypothetical protein